MTQTDAGGGNGGLLVDRVHPPSRRPAEHFPILRGKNFFAGSEDR